MCFDWSPSVTETTLTSSSLEVTFPFHKQAARVRCAVQHKQARKEQRNHERRGTSQGNPPLPSVMLCLTQALRLHKNPFFTAKPPAKDPDRHALLQKRLQDADAAFEEQKGE